MISGEISLEDTIEQSDLWHMSCKRCRSNVLAKMRDGEGNAKNIHDLNTPQHERCARVLLHNSVK
jgi:hypothetical protein